MNFVDAYSTATGTKRMALQIAIQLPADRDEAFAILDAIKVLYDTFLDEPAQPVPLRPEPEHV